MADRSHDYDGQGQGTVTQRPPSFPRYPAPPPPPDKPFKVPSDVVRLFDSVAVRDTATKQPLMLACPCSVSVAFIVRNGCNQAVSLTLVGGLTKDSLEAVPIANAVQVAANTDEAVVTKLWMPWMGLRASYSVAPTTGALTINATVQEQVT